MYKALYRKYRPKTFENLVGQEHITKVLKNQIDTNSISHAYLFSGTRGTGKTSCAKIFARGINCLSDEIKPCNKCENCIESLEESSIDIIEVDAASNNGVENIRDLKDRAFYQPTSLKYKVYIIDEVHMLSKGAFNALLKILEEPPAHLIFILATTEPEKIPLTILSRCQKFQFKRMDFQTIEKTLKYIGENEKIQIDDKTYSLIANSADGSMRDAQSILEQLVSSGYDEINYDQAVNILGLVNINIVSSIVDNIINYNAEGLLESIDDGLSSGKDIEQLGKDILNHFRNLMIAKVSSNSINRFISSNTEIYINQSKNISLNKILKSMEKLISQLNEMKYSQQKRALLEISLIEILEDFNGSEKLIESPSNSGVNIVESPKISEENKETKLEKNHSNNLKPAETKDVIDSPTKEESTEENQAKSDEEINNNSIDLDINKIKSDWNDILNKIKNSKKNLLQAIIIEASLVKFEDNILTLGFNKPYEFHKNKLMENENREFVEKVISMFYNNMVKINAIFIGDDNEDSIDKDIETLKDLVGEENIKIY